MRTLLTRGRILFASLALCGLTANAQAQTIDPFYASVYDFISLSSASDVPGNYGGLLVKPGDNNTLLLGGSANNSDAGIYSVSITRDANHRINGFTGTSTKVANANGSIGGIDGGLLSMPNGTMLYTSYNSNEIGQVKSGSAGPDKLVDLNALGVNASVGALAQTPPGFGATGHIKFASYNTGDWYDATLSPDNSGTFDITNVALKANLGDAVGPEGIIYVPLGSPLFANPSILVTEYKTGTVSSYELDANGDPLVSTRRTFLTGLDGAEGGTLDPVNNDFLFSTFGGGNHLLAVGGFAHPAQTPAPGALTVALFGAVPGALLLRRRAARRAKGRG